MKRALWTVFFILCIVVASHAARQVLLNQDTAYDAFSAADDNFLELYNSVSASTVIVDLGDDGGDDTEALDEIATTGDTNSVFTVTGNKLSVDMTKKWPAADSATTANTANSATTATTATTANAGDSATAFFSSGTIEAARLPSASGTTAGIVPTTSGAAEGDVAKVQADGTLAWAADAGAGGAVDTSGTPVAADFAKFTDADTIEGRSYAETKSDLSLDNVENTAISTWAGSANVVTLGTISTGAWNGTAIPLTHGGTGQATAQAAIDALTAVSAATNEWVLTKDTVTGNAVFKANPGAGAGTVDTTGAVNANEIAVFHDGDTLKALIESEFKSAYNMEAGTDYLAQQTIGIADNNLVEIDMVGVADNDIAKFTASGLEGRSYAELRSDLAVADLSGTIAANDYAKFSDSDTLIGRSYAEVKTDLSLNNVENTALSTWAGTTNVTTLGAISTGSWNATAIPLTKGGMGTSVSAVTGLLAVNGTVLEIDSKSELEGQIADVADFAEADGDVFTGTHDFHGATLKVENVYAYDSSGIILKDDAGTTGLTVLDGADVLVAKDIGVGGTAETALHIFTGTPYASTSNGVIFEHESDDNVSPQLSFRKKRYTTDPANDNDYLGTIRWDYYNDASEDTSGTSILAYVNDVSDGTEDTTMEIYTMVAGTGVATIIMKSGFVGVRNANPSVELDVTGSIEYTGTITDVSDAREKENISSITGALEKVREVNGVYFNMIDTPTRRELGFVAQDVQETIPELVSVVDPEAGTLGVNYIGMIPVLLEAIKDLDKIVKLQAAEIAALKEGLR